ncbi:quinone-dependent dihydroorotate dehydrogenase [Neorickettsia sennetsu]|uniref:Dihydroorotate dehydrogenase (quinone) n=1 Tax=Ehrlichia sennetsu (strain ATCC VR-367 / Miyayama) TaxID=222891 RepID=Q2GEM2_EHRS3|nr:quinone-dependent dihydroorotate dehydrogenase [Neorickettsia sennetsu]ABD45927.1 dihydroorotate dehydrogenase [Neorickettsia sennetsu str. Miyayama]
MHEKLLVALLQRLNPSFAHDVTRVVLKHFPGFVSQNSFEDPILESRVCGLHFKNPIGIAAGFDKNAECVTALRRVGFGFIELGTVTLKPQKGNPSPRLFRLPQDGAIINRLGFNNKGIAYFLKSLKKAMTHMDLPPLGVNIGKNAVSSNAVSDYARLAAYVSSVADYITLNISSPNTVSLRDMQKVEILEELLIAVKAAVGSNVRIFIKVAPDLAEGAEVGIISLALKHKVAGIIVSNTTIGCRESLHSKHKVEYGGLSGTPLFKLSTGLLRKMYRCTNGELVFIGCGGISDAETAYAKIRNGAALIQAYTSFTYHGFGLLNQIKKDLVQRLKADGFSSVSEAVGVDA